MIAPTKIPPATKAGGLVVEHESYPFSLPRAGKRPWPRVSVDLLGRNAVACGRRCGCRIRSGIAQAVLHQVDLHASAGGAMQFAICRCQRGIAHADRIDAVHRDVMVQYKVANHHLRHFPRTADRRAAATGSEALHFHDITLLTLQSSGHLIESVFGVLAEDRLPGTEPDLGLRNRGVLIELADRLL